MLGNDLYRKRSHLSDCDQCLIVKLSQVKVSAIAFKQFLKKEQQGAVKSYCLSYCEMNMPTVNICVKHVNWIPFPLDMPTKDSHTGQLQPLDPCDRSNAFRWVQICVDQMWKSGAVSK